MTAAPVAPAQADGPVVGSVIPSDAELAPEPKRSVRKARPKPSDSPLAQPSDKAAKSPSGGGSHLADVPQVKWETKKDGSTEAWHNPPGATKREHRTYLGRVGLALSERWRNLRPEARQKAVEGWIAMKREKKGIQ